MTCCHVGCRNVILMDSFCTRHLTQQCSICFEKVRSTNSPNTKRLRCGHSFHIDCILGWFVQSDDCPVCRQVQNNDKLLKFKQKIQHELREKYKCAIRTYEDELSRLRSTRWKKMVISSKMADRCTGTTVSGNRCKKGPNCHIHKDPCSICLSRITNDTRRTLYCGHDFHTHCIDRLKETGSNQCPLCRKLFDVSHFKISIKIVNTRAGTTSNTELPSESIGNIIDGLNFDFLDFS